jgi:hypothetical protein
VKDEFAKQYPEAENIEYEDNLVRCKVHFSIAGEKMLASYTQQSQVERDREGMAV